MVHYHMAFFNFSNGLWLLDVLRNELLATTVDAFKAGICRRVVRLSNRLSAHSQ